MRGSSKAPDMWHRLALFAVLVSPICAGSLLRAQAPRQERASRNGDIPPAEIVQLVAIGPAARGNEEECTGTGFFVNADGAIVTAAHVVEEARRCLEGAPAGKIVAKFEGSNPNNAEAISCDVVGLDKDHDLAVLKTERPPRSVFLNRSQDKDGRSVSGGGLFFDESEIPSGTRVSVSGHTGKTWRAAVAQGRVIERKSLILLESDGIESDTFILDVPLKKGASGSPVYLENGGVIGVIVESYPQNPSNTVAVSSSHAIKLLERLHIPFSTQLAR